jgi:hypothetical protein
MRLILLFLTVSVLFLGAGGCGLDVKVEKSATPADARRALKHLPWTVHLAKVSGDRRVVAGRVILGPNTGFRFVTLVGQRNLRGALAALPSVYRPLLTPDFGEASLLAGGPFIFVGNAAKRDADPRQKERELSAELRLESLLCHVSAGHQCAPV